MFRFRKEPRPPISDPRTLQQWFDDQPKTDIVALQVAVLDCLAPLAEGLVKPAPAVAEAVIALDELTDSLRRALTRQYTDERLRPAAVERQLWQSVFDLTQGFLQCYQMLEAEAVGAEQPRKWRAIEPQLLLHKIHHLGIDARFRMFRFEQWIPGKWLQFHAARERARLLECDRAPLPLTRDALTTIEHEYLKTLLLQLFNAGNLTPAEISAVADRLDDWVALVRLRDVSDDHATHFLEPSAAGAGLRRAGPDMPEHAVPIDLGGLLNELVKLVGGLRRKLAADPLSERTPRRNARVNLLLKLARQLDPDRSPLARRSERTPIAAEAFTVTSFPKICVVLRDEDLRTAAGLQSLLEGYRETTSKSVESPAAITYASVRRNAYGVADDCWQVKDQSASGARMIASLSEATSLTIGTLVAARLDGQADWKLYTIRRLRRLTSDRAEVGLQVMAQAVVGVELEAKQSTDDTYHVDGRSVTLSTSRYVALFVIGKASGNGPASRSIIVPPNAYDTTVTFRVSTARAAYAVRLGGIIERHGEWLWADLEILTQPPSEFTIPPI